MMCVYVGTDHFIFVLVCGAFVKTQVRVVAVHADACVFLR